MEIYIYIHSFLGTMFIRIKKIKGIEYAYLVKSVWKKKTARQKVVKYLGRVHILEKTNPISFDEFIEQYNLKITSKTSFKEIIQYLMAWTFCQHGFTKDPLVQKKWLFNHGKIVGDPAKLKLYTKNRNLTLKCNDGYMNSFTLKELCKIQISKKTEEQRQAATMLAKAFVTAGIAIPQDIFIDVFQKVYK